MNDKYKNLEKTLLETTEKLWSGADLKPSERTQPVLGLIFLKFADALFSFTDEKLKESTKTGRREITKEDYQAEGVLFLPKEARYSYLLNLPEGQNIAQAIEDAMNLIEESNDSIKGVLPKSYKKIENSFY